MILIVATVLNYLELIRLQQEQVIVKFPALLGLVITEVAKYVRIRLVSQLFKDLSRILQNLLKYINGTDMEPEGVFPVTFTLNLNDSKSVKKGFSHLCNIDINFQMFLI